MVVGLTYEGRREILGFWLFGSEGESANNWREVLVELKGRGLKRVEVVIGDGLRGLKEAVRIEIPGARFQLCVLHAVRGSLRKVRNKDRERVAESLKGIYRAGDREEAREGLMKFKERWGRIYPEVVRKWEENFNELTTFMGYPEEVRRFIYTTNQLERLMKEIKRRAKVIEVFSGVDSVCKVVYLVLLEKNERYRGRSLPGFKEAISNFRRETSYPKLADTIK